MSKDCFDFDAFIAEDVKSTPHTYKLFGVTGEIPATIPYGLVLEYQYIAQLKEEKGDDADVGTQTLHRMLEYIFGEDVVKQWVKNPKFDADVMQKVLRWAMKKYNLVDDEEETERPKEPVKRGKVIKLPSET